MRGWPIPIVLLVAGCSSHDGSGPGTAVDTPNTLSSTTLDGAIALSWSDNPFIADPDIFQNYRVYSTSYDLDNDACGTKWSLEGTTVAPEFVVGALTNGVPKCFSVTAESVDGFESARSPLRPDTPRPDARNVVVYAFQERPDQSGFRFWEDLDGDGLTQGGELGLIQPGTSNTIDFFVDRDTSGDLFLTPVRAGTGVEYYDDSAPVADLTSIDFAAFRTYRPDGILAIPGYGYVFQMSGGDGFKRYGAVRVTHVGQNFLILDWAFQTDPGNPELVVTHR
ncbi:MAG TPA: hypothetical protein VHR41_00175 [Gemmatimonadales bacterium]|jgi:hypothetical protein|nr:hypothetical protein [Gemmatimonadales bacterium]